MSIEKQHIPSTFTSAAAFKISPPTNNNNIYIPTFSSGDIFPSFQ